MLTGQAPDRGLYFLDKFPALTRDEIAAFANLPYHEIAFRVLSRFTEGTIEADTLARMCAESYDFEVPLEKIYDRVHSLRLDCGPTASFKDFAAQMMARMFGLFLRETGRHLTASSPPRAATPVPAGSPTLSITSSASASWSCCSIR